MTATYRNEAVSEFPGKGQILDLAGRPVDARGPIWRLNAAASRILLDWRQHSIQSPELLKCLTGYIAEQIRYKSPESVSNCFKVLRQFAGSEEFTKCDQSGSDVSYIACSTFIEALGPSRRYLGHYVRQWYLWCCDQGMERFDPEVAFRLTEMVFGGNEKGRSVLSDNKDDGPLSDTETVALLNALRASEMTGLISLREQTAIWLCVALGCNPTQYVLLRDGDYEALEDAGGLETVFQLRVPRMKKGHSRERAEFRSRKLIPEIALKVRGLLAENQERIKEMFPDGSHTGVAVPLFMAKRRQRVELNASMHEYLASMTNQAFTDMVAAAVTKLEVISPRTGQPLHVTSRRFRYTFATRMVREGASQRAVADALDHTDLQNVQCYFDLKSDIVEKLDAAMAMELGPLSQAFLGHLVRKEQDAVRGGERGSRLYHHAKESSSVQSVGTCGSFSFCGLTAPLACYTCVKFQPWMEAPHGEVLDHLLAERQRRQQRGLDGKMVGLFDTTILAVADVVSRIASLADQQAAVA